VKRPSWHESMFQLAELWAQRSTCPRQPTGAVFCNSDYQVLTSGYNGAVRGQKHCTEVDCLMVQGHCLRVVHAEMNGILQAARVGVSLKDALVYCTHSPCPTCAKALIQVGVARVLYRNEYTNNDGIREEIEGMFQQARIGLSPYVVT
jgi:dCMP deaminase